jgi:hypothetical protein
MSDSETRIKTEMVRLQRQIVECSNCAACREQMARLAMLLPPEPFVHNGLRYQYVRPPQEVDLVERMLKEWGL